jgi:hypothetical protein
VPILTELLRKDNKGIATSFGAAATLYDDPVAKALSEIGEPATDSVAGLFADGDAPTRRRAAIVLSNIGTPNAREGLLRQIDREPDPNLKTFMKSKVASLAPGSPNIAALPSANIPNSIWFAIGSDWEDNNMGHTSELRAFLNYLLTAMTISNPAPTLSGVLGNINNDVIVTTTSEFDNTNGPAWNTSSNGSQTVEFPYLAHAPMPALAKLLPTLASDSNSSVTTSSAVGNCVAQILLTSSTTGSACSSAVSASAAMSNESEATTSGEWAAQQQGEKPLRYEGETEEEAVERMKHPVTFAPQRMSVETPKGDVPLGSPIELKLTFAPGKLVGQINVLQSSATENLEQGSGPAKIVLDEGLSKTIQIVPVQTGRVDVLIGAQYSDNALVRQTVHLNVGASSKGLKKFFLDQGPGGMALVLEDKEEDRQMWMQPIVTYESLKFPVNLEDSTTIKLSVEQEESYPVVRVDKNGMVHALREGKAVIVGDFDGVIDRVPVTVYSKEDAPVGYRRVSD